MRIYPLWLKKKKKKISKETWEVLIVWADLPRLENFFFGKKANPQEKFTEHQRVQALFIHRSSWWALDHFFWKLSNTKYPNGPVFKPTLFKIHFPYCYTHSFLTHLVHTTQFHPQYFYFLSSGRILSPSNNHSFRKLCFGLTLSS